MRRDLSSTRCRLGAIATAVAAFGLGTGAGAADGSAPAPHPDAPAETAQFAFLVGRWDCATRSMKLDGSGYTDGRATWTGSFILGGWAIQDVWESHPAGGSRFYGINIRSFNPNTRKWDNRWLPSGSLQWTYYEAERVGETMVMTGGEGVDAAGRAYVDRNTFYEIGRDGWRWRKDRSFDAGKTWIEGVAHAEARRAGAEHR